MNSVILEVGIGLALLFYVMATLVSGVAEGITRLLNTRSKMLWAALERLMSESLEPSQAGSPKTGPTTLGAPLMFQSLVPGKRGRDARPEAQINPTSGKMVDAGDRLKDLAGAPSVRGLDYVSRGQTKVATISGKVFTSALFELASIKAGRNIQAEGDAGAESDIKAKGDVGAEGDSVANSLSTLTDEYQGTPLGGYLGALAKHAGEDIDSVTNSISDWFDQQMSRVTRTYRKNIKYLLAAIALIIALGFNVDTIQVAQGLARNADLRQVVSATAGDITQEDLTANCTTSQKDPTGRTLDCGLQKLNSLQGAGVVLPGPEWTTRIAKSWSWDSATATHVLGLALTTGAVSLGGPMWFDFLMLLTGRKRAP